jgi:hypothetical protein
MCIIIYRPYRAKQLDTKTFSNCWNNNPHGFGAMYRTAKGTLETFKTLKKHEAKQFFLDSQKNPEIGDIAYHFRLATHGKKDENNCHPFDVGNSFFLMHNGIFDLDDPKNEKSDTALFAEFIQKLPKDWHKYTTIHKIIQTFTDYSKCLFMSPTENYIPSLQGWVQEDKIYFSNTCYKYNGIFYDSPKKKKGKKSEYLDDLDDNFCINDKYPFLSSFDTEEEKNEYYHLLEIDLQEAVKN